MPANSAGISSLMNRIALRCRLSDTREMQYVRSSGMPLKLIAGKASSRRRFRFSLYVLLLTQNTFGSSRVAEPAYVSLSCLETMRFRWWMRNS